jgi:prepilin-type N-terminal cleavage/methylation domain-containing protein
MQELNTEYGMESKHKGFTLVELLIVIGIISILTVGILGVGEGVSKKGKIRMTKTTMQVLNVAARAYKDENDTGQGGVVNFFPSDFYFDFYPDYIFPTDPYEFDPPSAWLDNIPSTTAGYDTLHDEYIMAMQSTERFLYQLNQVPACEIILNKLSNSVKENSNENWFDDSAINPLNEPVSLPEIVDGWGRPMRYRNQGPGNFPRFFSAGADGLYLTEDDIVSSDLY